MTFGDLRDLLDARQTFVTDYNLTLVGMKQATLTKFTIVDPDQYCLVCLFRSQATISADVSHSTKQKSYYRCQKRTLEIFVVRW